MTLLPHDGDLLSVAADKGVDGVVVVTPQSRHVLEAKQERGGHLENVEGDGPAGVSTIADPIDLIGSLPPKQTRIRPLVETPRVRSGSNLCRALNCAWPGLVKGVLVGSNPRCHLLHTLLARPWPADAEASFEL